MCDEEITKKEIEEYLTLYDKQIEDRIAKEQIAEEDDDGWVTIAAGKKRGQFAPSRKESTIGKVQQKEEQRKKKKQLLNFYTFQIREAKKQSKCNFKSQDFCNTKFLLETYLIYTMLLLDLAELRKKFELDKKRLQELKLKRTFKPF